MPWLCKAEAALNPNLRYSRVILFLSAGSSLRKSMKPWAFALPWACWARRLRGSKALMRSTTFWSLPKGLAPGVLGFRPLAGLSQQREVSLFLNQRAPLPDVVADLANRIRQIQL